MRYFYIADTRPDTGAMTQLDPVFFDANDDELAIKHWRPIIQKLRPVNGAALFKWDKEKNEIHAVEMTDKMERSIQDILAHLN